VWVNNRNRNVLVLALLHSAGSSYPDGLYLWSNGQLRPIAIPGQDMPGGGKLDRIGLQPHWLPYLNGVSYANGGGQHAFIAQLQDGTEAAYRMDADGSLSLILNQEDRTDLGTVRHVGLLTYSRTSLETSQGIGLNIRGQVALVIQFESGPPTLVLLTPDSP
jgi:hypothetical protein